MSAEGVPVLLDRADVLKALRDTLSVTDNRVTQAFGKPWLDDAASRIMAIQPALPASTADAREEAWKAMVEALEMARVERDFLSNGCGERIDAALALAAKSGGEHG